MTHRALPRRSVRTLLGVCVVALATSLSLWLAPLPATAADGDVTVHVEGLANPILVNADGTVLVPGGNADGVQAASQCFGAGSTSTDPTKACLGVATETEQVPLDVGGRGALYGLIKAGPEAAGALGPIAVDATRDVRAAFDLPNDARIPAYARAEVRAAIVDSLMYILDKGAYGVPLNADERRAFDWLEQEFLERDRKLARWAYEEYEAFKSSPCTYTPPPHPASVTKPETMPEKVTEWCRIHSGQVATLVDIAPPLPTAQQFTTWASYRHADELGLTAFADPVLQKNLVGTAIAVATLGGFAVAAAAGAGAYYLATATTIASTLAAKLFPHLIKPLWEKGAGWITRLVAKMVAEQAGAWAGAVSAAVIAAVAIVAIVVIGVATYLVIQHESVAASLQATIDAAAKADDPFQLEPLQEKLEGKPLNSVLFTETPDYRTEGAYSRLASLVVLWTSAVKEETPAGDVTWEPVPDKQGVWADSAHTDTDPQWIVRVGDRDPVLKDTLRVPQSDKGETVYPSVSMSRGWFVIRQGDTTPRPALSFGYYDEQGDASLAQRAPSSVGGFIVSRPKEGVSTETARELTFRNSDGDLVRARLQRRAPVFVAGPRPAAVGPLWTGRPVLLRPNPVAANGASLDPTEIQEDFDFDWTVERLDPETGEWGVVHTASGYGTSFVPTEPGEYDARVTMTAIGNPDEKRYGAVRFAVDPPPIEAPVVQLQDDGGNRLELDLQLQEEVPSDDLTVEVTWPGELGTDTDPTTTLEQDCSQTGPLECTTQQTGPSNLLVRTLTPATDLRRPVRLTVTNATGGVYQAEFLLGSGRPSTAAPAEGANDDEPGTAVLDPSGGVQVEMPLAFPTENQDYTVARLVPTAGGQQTFNLLDPETGNTTGAIELPGSDGLFASVFQEGGSWYLQVSGIPEPEDLGSYSVPLVVGQTNSTRTMVPVAVHVLPSTGDRFRGALLTDVDPDDNSVDVPPVLEPAVLGGKVGEPAYRGQMCVSLHARSFEPTPVVQCRDVDDYVKANGVARAFPYAELFPTGLRGGSYRAEAWLATPGENVDTDPLGVSFVLGEDASYPPPKVQLDDVTIGGKARVGRTLTAQVGSVHPESAVLTYRWMRDGNAIRGANEETYVLKRADRGHRLTVQVTAKVDDWVTAKRTSPRTGVVR